MIQAPPCSTEIRPLSEAWPPSFSCSCSTRTLTNPSEKAREGKGRQRSRAKHAIRDAQGVISGNTVANPRVIGDDECDGSNDGRRNDTSADIAPLATRGGGGISVIEEATETGGGSEVLDATCQRWERDGRQ